MKLIAGLGNPGREYQDSRHNIGFLVIDHIADFYGIPLVAKRFAGVYGSGRICGKDLLIVKPQTYMNRSGECIGRFKEFLGITNEEILVIYDDLDLPFGRLRIRKGGGSGGHRGVSSIISALGDEDFPRIRMGIGRPPDDSRFKVQGSKLIVDYVLSPFNRHEKEVLQGFVERGRAALESILVDGIDKAMSRFNNR